jgi:hypothetical protein
MTNENNPYQEHKEVLEKLAEEYFFNISKRDTFNVASFRSAVERAEYSGMALGIRKAISLLIGRDDNFACAYLRRKQESAKNS